MGEIVTPTTFTAAWIVVLGLVGLVVQAIAQQPAWTAGLKRIITVVVAVLLGTVYVVATGGISVVPGQVQAAIVYWFIVVAGIIAVGQAVYGFLKPYLEKLEVATSPDALGEPGDPPA